MKNKIITILAAGAMALVGAQTARANADLSINGGAPVVMGTGTAGLYSSGGITAMWDTSGTVTLDLDYLGGGPITVAISDDGNFPGGGAAVVSVSADVTGSLTGSFAAYWDAGNALFAQTTQLGSTLTLPSASSASGKIVDASPYSLTEVLTISSGRGTISADSHVTVPDGGTTIAMLGLGFAGLGALRTRFSKKA